MGLSKKTKQLIFVLLAIFVVSLIVYYTFIHKSVKTIGPSTIKSWQKINYNYGGLDGTDASAGTSETANQEYVLNHGYDCYVYDGNATIYPRRQGTSGTGNTLLVYKNGSYWTASNTNVEFGPNTTSDFTSQTLGEILTILKTTSFNMVLLRGIVSPTAESRTIVSGTYSSDIAMLNVNSDTGFFTWFYGGTSFPYSYTLKSFEPTK